MTTNFTFFKAVGVSWTILLLLPSLKADFRLQHYPDLPTRPSLSSILSSSPAQHNVSLHSSSSALHTIIHQNGFHLHAQPSKTGASNLHKIIQRLGHFTHFSRKHPKNKNNNNTKEDTNTHIPSSINNARLKRQLEGIFHVRGTPASTIIPILPSKSLNKPPQLIHNDRNDVNRNNKTKTTEKEIQEGIRKTNNKYPFTTTNKNVDFTDTDIPRAIKDKRNFTVEIVEISRKTLIKQDSGDEDDKLPGLSENKKNIDSKESLQNANFLKPTSIFNPSRPRLLFRKLRRPSQLKILDDSQNSPTQTHKETTSNPKPEISKPVRERKQADKSQDKSVEVKVSYQEHIPYNERDIDEADLKDYLDGHSTFGSKGNFKHKVSRNVTGFLPTQRKNGHELHKRTPQPPVAGSAYLPRSRARSGQGVNIEQVKVKEMKNHPRTTVYTASGPNSVSDTDEDNKSVFEYQGNRVTPPSSKKPEATKDQSSFGELFRQGHPGILEAPQPIHKSHPLGEPYGQQQDDNEDHGNPFRANPLIDEPPLKFDPESDRFYGEPTPEKEKRLAQSNRPEPVRVENQTPEYQYERPERPPTIEPRNDNNDDRYGYQRDYEPNDYDYEKATDVGDRGTDPYIRDFVSLDSNFERLPRPSAADESFKSLVPAEAEDDSNSQYFDEDDRNNNYRDNDGRSRSKDPDDSTSRSQGRRGEDDRQYSRQSQPPRRQSDDGSSDDYRDSRDDFGENENPSEHEGASRENFDPSYVDALSHFDEEIKRIQENDRKGLTTGNPHATMTTREPPLVITSPGPVVPYPTRGNIQRPTHGTTPRESEESDEERDREDQQTRQPDDQTNRPDDNEDRNQSKDKSEEVNDEEEEEEAEEPEENQKSTTSNNADDQESDKEKEAEDSRRKKRMGIKISRTSKNITTSNKPGEDKSGNLDEDITSIENEFGKHGYI